MLKLYDNKCCECECSQNLPLMPCCTSCEPGTIEEQKTAVHQERGLRYLRHIIHSRLGRGIAGTSRHNYYLGGERCSGKRKCAVKTRVIQRQEAGRLFARGFILFQKSGQRTENADVTGTITTWRAALSKTAVRNLKFDFRPANWKAAA